MGETRCRGRTIAGWLALSLGIAGCGTLATGGAYRSLGTSSPLPAAWAGTLDGVFGLVTAPAVATGSQAPDTTAVGGSLYVARVAQEMTLRYRIYDRIELRLPIELGYLGGAMVESLNGLPVSGVVGASGLGVAWTWLFEDGGFVGLLADGMLMGTRYRELRPGDEQDRPGVWRENRVDLLFPLGRLAAGAGWQDDVWRVYAGVTVRNQPWIGVEVETTEAGGTRAVPVVDGGPVFLVFTGALEVRPWAWLSLLLLVHQPVCLETNDWTFTPIVQGGIGAYIP